MKQFFALMQIKNVYCNNLDSFIRIFPWFKPVLLIPQKVTKPIQMDINKMMTNGIFTMNDKTHSQNTNATHFRFFPCSQLSACLKLSFCLIMSTLSWVLFCELTCNQTYIFYLPYCFHSNYSLLIRRQCSAESHLHFDILII